MTARTNPIPSVWARQQPAPDQPALSRAAIVREAIVMLDAEGIEALSMRKLGARLNAGATSLYRHVATKDELMELAVDEVAAEITVPSPDV
ncbi:helix-turn-helix domain-containing protein, partial [Streptomyces sp. NPDC079189]